MTDAAPTIPASHATPVRIQLRRSRGFRLQPSSMETNGLPAVKIDRTTRWGNPHEWTAWRDKAPENLAPGPELDDWCRAQAVAAYERDAEAGAIPDVSALRGRNLACWCGPGSPCHGTVLLRYANA